MAREIYRRIVVVALVGIAVLSAASALILAFGEAPRMVRLSPEAVRVTIVTMLALFGVLVPLALVLNRGVRTRARLLVPIGCLVAGLSNAVALGEPVQQPIQVYTSNLAVYLSLAFLILAAVALMEERDDRPVGSSMGR